MLKGASRRSWLAIRPHVLGPRVLDVGAAEGWIGDLLSKQDGHDVQLIDVVDLNRTSLPHRIYNGTSIPFQDDAFDTVLVMLTLHHCKSPETVLDEAIRVSSRRLIVTESTYRFLPGRWLLWTLDTIVNALRSRCLIPVALHFRRDQEWEELFRNRGLILRKKRHLSRGLHRHVMFVLDVRSDSRASV
ncbi:MAG: methyltransferase domain-containing protein [Candidatus Sumerlaeia bacterium]|nr:methyltransferase domain-containing protein [Candidatus Sumerlaeia bacterium]